MPATIPSSGRVAKPRRPINNHEMKTMDPEPTPPTTPDTGDATPAARLTLSSLLQRPFDIRSFALTGLFILALFYTLYFLRSVLLPIVFALLLSYLFRPMVRALGRARINPHLGAAVVLLAVLGLLGYGTTFLAAPVAGWLEKAPYGLSQLQQKLLPLKASMAQVAQASGELEKLTEASPSEGTTKVEVRTSPLQNVILGRTPEFLVSFVLLLILLYFLLAYDAVFLGKVIRILPTLRDKKRAVTIAHEIESHISRYLVTITIINTCLGIAVGFVVWLLGLQNPIMWGVLVAVLNFVPYLGALTGIICMTIGAILSFDSLGYAMLFPAAYFTITSIEGSIITPYVMGKSLTLNPVIILLSLTFWGWMWGIVGIILAVPILAAFKIFCTHIEQLEPISEFLS